MQARLVVVAELLLCVLQLRIRLLLEETNHLLVPLLLLVALLLLSHLELFTAHTPKLSEVLFLLLLHRFLVLLLLNLKGATSLNSLFHFELASLLVLK